jgi:hypothetical protein
LRVYELWAKIWRTTMITISEEPWFLCEISSAFLTIDGLFELFLILTNSYRRNGFFETLKFPCSEGGGLGTQNPNVEKLESCYLMHGKVEEIMFKFSKMKGLLTLAFILHSVTILQNLNFSKQLNVTTLVIT